MLDPITRYLKRLIDGSRSPAGPSEAVAATVGRAASAPEPCSGLRRVEREFAEADLDADAVRVIRRLTGAGHEAYLVGGCVRDLLFGVRPKDFDIVTSAQPPEIKRLFRNSRIIGRRFRLAHVHFRDKILEVATFRADISRSEENDESGILIRDDNVFGTAEQDAARRDFTINALFYDVDGKTLLDYVGGVDDAEHRVIRMIGDPAVRLREDPIRMLRAIRLAARLDCSIDAPTWKAIARWRGEILDAASPRIGEELLRMFRGGAMAPAFDLMLASSVIETILPELSHHLKSESEDDAFEELEAMRCMLRLADRWAHEDRQLTPAVHMAVLLSPVLLDATVGRQLRDVGTRLGELLRPIAQRLSISKRDSEKIRLVLQAQERLAARRRRRGAVGSLVKRAYFPEALDLFELITEATGDLRDEAGRWRRRLEEAFPEGAPPAPTRKAPRRRRRRREHGEKGARTG